jgi:hypothetical protein
LGQFFELLYIATTHAAKEAIWLRRLIDEIIGPINAPTPIFCDNNGAVTLAKQDAVFHPRTKHIDIRYHYIRQLVEDRSISIIRINTDNNLADMFTKSLARPKFESFTTQIGIGTIEEEADEA